MIEILTEHQAKAVSKLEFCYVCEKPFTKSNPSTDDHVPPKGIFLPEDRNWPLILPAHEKCNSEYSFSDEQAKGLIALLHSSNTGKLPLKTKQVGIVERGGKPTGVLLADLSLCKIVSRILRACHAALYHEFLRDEDTNRVILLPLPIFDPKTGDVDKNEQLPQHQTFCKLLKDNRSISNIDRIQAYNGKFRFEVVWATTDDNKFHFGVFAINLYDWHNLASQVLGEPQGCCGSYRLDTNPIPENASVATAIELPLTYSQLLNPFETNP